MAGRPGLPVGTHGVIRVRPVTVTVAGKPVKRFRAYTYFRDADGVRRLVSRTADSKTGAERELKASLVGRAFAGAEDITADTRFGVAAEAWFSDVQEKVREGSRSPSTAQLYRGQLDRHVIPALGQLRLREVTTARLDPALKAIGQRAGNPTARTCRTIIGGVIGFAIRRGAGITNPIRDTDPISVKPKKPPRGLTGDEKRRWLEQIDGDEVAVRKDLPTLIRFCLATGVRIGEALAVVWSDIDLDGTEIVVDGEKVTVHPVTIDHTIVPVKGQGLVRKNTKTTAGSRVLLLPASAVELLRERRTSTRFSGSPDDQPVFPNARGGFRDPRNVHRDIRNARGGDEFAWVTSHSWRKTVATELDEAGLTAREVANQLGHARPSITMDNYMGRRITSTKAADALDGSS